MTQKRPWIGFYPKATRATFEVPENLVAAIGGIDAVYDRTNAMCAHANPEEGIFYAGMTIEPVTVWIDYEPRVASAEEVRAFYESHMEPHAPKPLP